jgi:hypothetical protein
MDTKIQSVISSITETVATAIKTQMDSMETTIAKLVADAIVTQTGTIVTQVAASITGENSPFVTGNKLKHVLDDFIVKNQYPHWHTFRRLLRRPERLSSTQTLKDHTRCTRNPHGHTTITNQ